MCSKLPALLFSASPRYLVYVVSHKCSETGEAETSCLSSPLKSWNNWMHTLLVSFPVWVRGHFVVHLCLSYCGSILGIIYGVFVIRVEIEKVNVPCERKCWLPTASEVFMGEPNVKMLFLNGDSCSSSFSKTVLLSPGCTLEWQCLSPQ